MKVKHGGSHRVSQRKRKRDIIYRERAFAPAKDYMWGLNDVLDYFYETHNIHYTKLFFMLYIYSMESFFIDAIAKKYGRQKANLWRNVIKPLIRDGLMDEILYNGVREDYYFQDEEDYHKGPGKGDILNRRWGLSQRGRNLVSEMYRMVEK